MNMSIRNISLQACYSKTFPINNHFQSITESFPPKSFAVCSKGVT